MDPIDAVKRKSWSNLSSVSALRQRAFPARRRGLWLLLPLLAGFGCGRKASAPIESRAIAAPGQAAPPAAVPDGAAGPSRPGTAGLRTAIDLLANRVHGVVYRDGRLTVEAGALDFLKYVDGGWKTSWYLGDSDQGQPAALVAGLSALMFLPVDADEGAGTASAPKDATLSITMRGLAPNQKMSLFVNEKPAGTIEIAATRKRYDLPVPAGSLHAGDNRVRLTFKGAADVGGGRRSAAALTAVAFGPGAAPAAEPTDEAVKGKPPGEGDQKGAPAAAAPVRQQAAGAAGRHATLSAALEPAELDLGGIRRRSLLPGGQSSRVSFYFQLPKGAELAFGYGAVAGGGSAAVRVAIDGQPARPVYEGNASSRWTDAVVDLGAASGHVARIDLIGRGGEIAWAEPRVVVNAPPPPALPAPQPRFDHIYIWMVDTLRADKVHAFNPSTRVQTPNYDAFAADATRFAWAQVPGTWSLPSHASLLTGVYPTLHKATAHEARVSKDVPFIAEEMKKGGYKTGIFSSNGYVSPKWGFDRGWDVDRNFIRESLSNGAEFLWKTAKAWIGPNLPKREFVYLATIEPHVAYTPKKEFLAKYWDKPYTGPIKPVQSGVQLGLIKAGKLKPSDTDKAYLEALHDAEITQSDAAFATFVSDLKKLGVYDTSAVIVVADHGDQFYEHGSVGHGDTVYQELTHVPLIIRAPGLFPAGHVVQADVEIMDVYATVLDLAGIKPGPTVQGVTLTPLAYDELGARPRAALTVDGQIARGLKVERYRLVHRGPGRIELYDELADPREQKDEAATHPLAVREMRGVLALLYAYETTWSKGRWGTAANVAEPFYALAGPPGHRGQEPKSGGPK